MLRDLHAVGARRNTLGRRGDLRHGLDDRADKEAADKKHRRDENEPRRKRNEADHKHLPVDVFKPRHVPQNADDLAIGVDHRTRDRKNPLVRVGVAPLIARELPGHDGLLNVRRLGAFSSKLTVRGRDQLAARADELQFQLVLVFKRLGKLDAGLIVFVAALADVIAEKVGKVYGHEFTAKSNKFYGLSHHSNLNVVHGAMKTLADDLMKIANDVRFLASGPRAGYDELNIPANEPGSSIMPGKVNPTQAEAITMAAVRVTGNDVVVGMASSQGNFEMNVYKPVLIEAFLESADLLAGTMRGFADKMISGLTVNENRMKELVDNSLMTVTALSPHIGYHDSAKIAQKADKEGTTLREAAIASGKVTPEQFDEWVDPLKMTNIDR